MAKQKKAKARAKKSTPKKATRRQPDVEGAMSWFNNALTSPLVREAVAAALLAGAGAAAAVFAGRSARSKKAGRAGSTLTDATMDIASAAVGAAADVASETVKGMLPDNDQTARRQSR